MCRQRVEGERTRPCQTPRHPTLYPRSTSSVNPKERPNPRTRARGGRKEGRAGTVVPDPAPSYTQPKGPNPRTTAHGGRTERERGYGCARHRGITHSNERGRGGQRARLCQIPRHLTLYPRPTSIVNLRERPARAQQRVVAERRERERARLCQTPHHHTLNREAHNSVWRQKWEG